MNTATRAPRTEAQLQQAAASVNFAVRRQQQNKGFLARLFSKQTTAGSTR